MHHESCLLYTSFGNNGLYDIPELMHQLRQMHRLCFQRDLPALNAAHIQHIVDKGQKMLAGNGYLFQIVLYLTAVVDVRLRQRGEADDGIHGRPDIVGHIKQELPLGKIGLGFTLNGKLERDVFLLERLPVFLLGVLLLYKEIDVYKRQAIRSIGTGWAVGSSRIVIVSAMNLRLGMSPC